MCMLCAAILSSVVDSRKSPELALTGIVYFALFRAHLAVHDHLCFLGELAGNLLFGTAQNKGVYAPLQGLCMLDAFKLVYGNSIVIAKVLRVPSNPGQVNES